MYLTIANLLYVSHSFVFTKITIHSTRYRYIPIASQKHEITTRQPGNFPEIAQNVRWHPRKGEDLYALLSRLRGADYEKMEKKGRYHWARVEFSRLAST